MSCVDRLRPRYALGLRVVHWLTAAFVVVQLATAALNAVVYEGRPLIAETAVQIHISIGAAILVLTVLRVALRLHYGAPRMPGTPPRWIRLCAGAVHGLLYLSLIAFGVTGYLKLALLGFEIRLFGLVALPALPLAPDWALGFASAHRAAAILAGLVLSVHIVAAIGHRRLFGTPVLHRMGLGSIARGAASSEAPSARPTAPIK